ncbi:hypothetical protein GJ25_gp050 [Mycobacterium phage Hawkeye]|uniref:Uncharacterized protein n=1 Tax=Mycobacterium phage Hawkeye TaxID=1458711 RepID=X2KSN4_9CAUD|nr:hypothetical protein GJ25_gp050 [Mycobacterium phage Hawkeye]AHN84061.1 hypothetical protein PBI_HAWKEYE_50 [Mycobacterium phage Hawkeye]
MSHWIATDDVKCTCLTRDSGRHGQEDFAHAVRCAAAEDHEVLDASDIRELAEIAANSDIDTAVSIYRAVLNRAGR